MTKRDLIIEKLTKIAEVQDKLLRKLAQDPGVLFQKSVNITKVDEVKQGKLRKLLAAIKQFIQYMYMIISMMKGVKSTPAVEDWIKSCIVTIESCIDGLSQIVPQISGKSDLNFDYEKARPFFDIFIRTIEPLKASPAFSKEVATITQAYNTLVSSGLFVKS